jgi:hypothetical protein
MAARQLTRSRQIIPRKKLHLSARHDSSASLPRCSLPSLQRQLQANGGRSLVLTPLDLSRTVVLCTSEHLPLGVTATAVYELLEDVVQAALKEQRWMGIRPPSIQPSN